MSQIVMGGNAIDTSLVESIDVGHKTPVVSWVLMAVFGISAAMLSTRNHNLAAAYGLAFCIVAIVEIVFHRLKRSQVRISMTTGRVVVLPCLSVEHSNETAMRLRRLVSQAQAQSEPRVQGRTVAG